MLATRLFAAASAAASGNVRKWLTAFTRLSKSSGDFGASA